MSAINPRASGLWASSRMSYISVADSYDEETASDVDLEAMDFEVPEDDGRTPLDRTIDRIGMGSYQWTLLCLCGFGWLADNMWIQAVAVILPRVQQHFSVQDRYIGLLSSSMFAGMMFGAVGWGACSDLMGRTTAFNATLFLTSLFGILASVANTFAWLCIALFFLGSAVGGSMPTDGTLLLEHMPNGKQYLVTALSVFFSFGAVLAAVIGLIVIPGHSCPPVPAPCDVTTQNMGWKYLLIGLGLITLSMFLARMVFFRLHESPRYLVHAGRPLEAIESLQMISKFNGSELFLDPEDVDDTVPASASATQTTTNLANTGAGAEELPTQQQKVASSPSSEQSSETLRASPQDAAHYSAVGQPGVSLDTHQFGTPLIPETTPTLRPDPRLPSPTLGEPAAVPTPRPPRSRQGSTAYRRSRRMSTASEYIESKSRPLCRVLPRWMRRSALAWIDRVAMVLSPEWMRTTLLVWAAWCGLSLAYTMFNVYLPKLLETRSPSNDPDGAPKSLEDSLWDVVIYSLGGCPGAILGAWLIESPLGRRWSLAGSTFLTAFFCWIFAIVEHPWLVRASTVGISLSATAMYAVLYGWTPEIFGTKVRGTACGIASALSRVGGMIAPILGGSLLVIDHTVPVYTSIVVFIVSGICVILIEDRGIQRSGPRVIAH